MVNKTQVATEKGGPDQRSQSLEVRLIQATFKTECFFFFLNFDENDRELSNSQPSILGKGMVGSRWQESKKRAIMSMELRA